MRNYLLFILAFVLVSCGDASKREFKLTPAKGGVYYGGTFRYNEEEYFKTLYPLNITEVTAHRIIEQIYEGLVTFDDSTLAVIPNLAKYWTIDESKTKYTFILNNNVYFQDDACFPDGKGRKMTAQDVKYCFDRLCYHHPADNQGFWIFKDVVKGANEYDSLTEQKIIPKDGVSGVRVINDTTLEIELYKPFSVFLPRLGLAFAKVYPHEAIEKYGELIEHAVGTGPFYLKVVRANQAVFLERNKKYWKKDEYGNQLPYLNAIRVSFIKDKKNELLEFQKGQSDLVYKFPLEMIGEIVNPDNKLQAAFAKFQLQYMPTMSLQYYGFQHQGKIFNNINLRKAFCYAVDRERLCKYTLKGTGFPAIYGSIPPGTGTYDAKQVKGYHFNPVLAKEYLAKAGYPNGRGLQKIILELNSGGGRNISVAEAIKKMLEENLNIKMELLMIPWAQHTEAVESAKADFYRLGWVADYPDGENFLNLFHSKYVPADINTKTSINSFRYINKKYDEYLDKALNCVDPKEINEYYIKADQQMIDDAVMLPIYYDIDYRLLQPYVRNCPQNAMEFRDFSETYFIPFQTSTQK